VSNSSAAPFIRTLQLEEWSILREMRLRTLTQSPQAFGGNLALESEWTPQQWQDQLKKFDYVVASDSGKNLGGLSIETLEGDFGATCWIGSCWVDEAFRGQGVLTSIISYVDSRAAEKHWQIQGLGVWIDNLSAIAAYEKLGFVAMGPQVASSSKPGNFYQRMIRNVDAIAPKNHRE